MLEIEKAVSGQPYLDEAVRNLENTGIYQKEFKSQEVVEVMSMFVLYIIKNRGASDTSISRMNVKIENAIGTIKGTVDVKKPAKVKIHMNCDLDNDNDPEKIKLLGLNVVTEAGLLSRIALKAADTVGKTKDDLQKPNEVFLKFLDTQFRPRGISINKLGLHFNENTLSINLRGGSFLPGRGGI